ncbi:hypothetical protein L227DRAFT_262070 [Lentinus tigrinus ALCF2SS1-6]|uniref:Uncharacterized protein n=1 Tax=Lentinus tigrinus ALCF2SS1-6 TaxID=1328759 RepID=A0A5C2SNB4_9APHY|nr:hypothetical protein L227DRAFT_262070 [Lentinus tigrinus ALCF2SS1-6]
MTGAGHFSSTLYVFTYGGWMVDVLATQTEWDVCELTVHQATGHRPQAAVASLGAPHFENAKPSPRCPRARRRARAAPVTVQIPLCNLCYHWLTLVGHLCEPAGGNRSFRTHPPTSFPRLRGRRKEEWSGSVEDVEDVAVMTQRESVLRAGLRFGRRKCALCSVIDDLMTYIRAWSPLVGWADRPARR